jgi:hypothetical protein
MTARNMAFIPVLLQNMASDWLVRDQMLQRFRCQYPTLDDMPSALFLAGLTGLRRIYTFEPQPNALYYEGITINHTSLANQSARQYGIIRRPGKNDNKGKRCYKGKKTKTFDDG